MPKIFISYRREDSKHAVGRLHAALRKHVGNPKRDIFIDIDNIPKGVDFVEHLDGKVAECDVMLAVIGPHWLGAADPLTQRRRLDDPADFVRIEVGSALKRGIPVVPVVLDDTPIPSADALPDDLKPLARRNGERLAHESFEADVARLIRGLPSTKRTPAVVATPAQPQAVNAPGASATPGLGWLPLVAGIVLVGGIAVAAIALDPLGWRSPAPEPPQTAEQADSVSPAPAGRSTSPPAPVTTAPPAPGPQSPASDPAPPPQEPVFRTQPVDTLAPATDTAKPPAGPRIVSEVRLANKFYLDDAAFSPDRSRLVASSDAGDNVYNAAIWDARTGKLVSVLSGHRHLIADVAWSRDGERVATGTLDDPARLWDPKTGQLVAALSGAGANAIGLDFSPDSARIVTASADRTASIWDARTGQLLLTLSGHTDWVTSAAFSADGRRVLTASRDKTARLWDAATGQVLMTFAGGHADQLLSASFSPDESRIVTTSYDKTIRIWNASTGEALAQSSKEANWVYFATFSPDGKRLITSSGRVLNATTAKPITSLKTERIAHADFSADGMRVTTVGADGYIRTWQLDR